MRGSVAVFAELERSFCFCWKGETNGSQVVTVGNRWYQSAVKGEVRNCRPLLTMFFLSSAPTAILLGYPQSLPHVQSVWIHLDTPDRALPEPLPARAIGPGVPHHPASLPLYSGASGGLRTAAVLQLQPFRPAHELGHMELFIQPQLQLAALQRLRLLWRCLKQVNTAELNYNWKLISQEKEIKKNVLLSLMGKMWILFFFYVPIFRCYMLWKVKHLLYIFLAVLQFWS